MRKAILEIITPQDIKDIVESLIDLAIEGNLHAAKLVLGYAIGKPEWMDRVTMTSEGFAEPSTNGVFQEEPSTNGIFSPPPLGEGPGGRAERCSAPPSPNGIFEELMPSTNGLLQETPSPNGIFEELMPSTNGDFAPPLNRRQRRALRKAKREAKRQRNSPKPVPQPVATAS